jgi:hypothetical protein
MNRVEATLTVINAAMEDLGKFARWLSLDAN